jgi:hypothetical protein
MCDAGEILAKLVYARSDKDFTFGFATIAVIAACLWREK